MAQNWKPIIEELKTKFANRDQLRDTVLENLKQTRIAVEKTLKQVAEEAKDSKLVLDYVVPLAESEKTDKALKYFNEKLGANSLVTKFEIVSKLESARKSLIDLKVSNAKSVDGTDTETPSSAEAVESSEEKKARKKSAKSASETEA